MTKIISLNSYQKQENKTSSPYENLIIPNCDWNITIFPNGKFFSGLPDFMVAMLERSCKGISQVDRLIEQTEKNYNVNILFNLAVLEQKIPRTQIFETPPYHRLIDRKDSKEKLLFQIIPVESDDICSIWHENPSLNKIYDNLEKARDLTRLFMHNIDMAWDIDVAHNGEIDESFGDIFKKGFLETTIYDFKNFKNYIDKASPKEQYNFMGFSL